MSRRYVDVSLAAWASLEFSSTSRSLTRGIRNAQRMAQIANVFARHGLWSALEIMGLSRELTPEQSRKAQELSREQDLDDELAETNPEAATATVIASESSTVEIKVVPVRLREAFEELGPAFVKLGQVLATREDLIPPSFVAELSKLHSTVQMLPFEELKGVILDEIGEDGWQQFKKVDHQPLAAGSIAQVHRAELLDGRQVVLKIQRPGIAKKIAIDLGLMESLAALIERYIPDSKILQPMVAIDEFRRATLGELDFIREAGTTTKIAANFADDQRVAIPNVIWELTTSKLLTITYLDGVTVNDQEKLKERNIDSVRLVEHGLNVFLQMVFKDGFFHGDLHPGNLLALSGDRVGILDFGLAVRLSNHVRERLAGLLMALLREDYESLASHFVELSDPAADFDMDAFVHEVSNSLAPFVGLNLGDVRSGYLLWDLAKIAAKHRAPLPRELILFLRTFVAFEGIGTQLNPDFDVTETCKKFAAEAAKDMYSSENLKRQSMIIARDFVAVARTAPRQLRGLMKAAIDGDLHLNVSSSDVRNLASVLDRTISRVTVGLLGAALIIGSAILLAQQAQNEIYRIPLAGLIGFGLSGACGLYVIWSIIRGR